MNDWLSRILIAISVMLVYASIYLITLDITQTTCACREYQQKLFDGNY
jgi:hypothetical protein